MEDIISGLNKVICRTAVTNDGQNVTITDGTTTWTSAVVAGVATFLIPSRPAQARGTYTVTLGNYSRVIDIGFGDTIDITLDAAHEPAYQGDITYLQNQIDAGLTVAEVTAVRALLAAVNNKTLVGASASGTVLYLESLT